MIVCRTPLRISLVGGGTDTPSFYEKHPGCVVSFAINKYVYIILNKKFDSNKVRVSYSVTENVNHIGKIKHPIIRNMLEKYGSLMPDIPEIVSVADIPGEGSGLGSSSSFTVGLLNAIAEYSGFDQAQCWRFERQAFELERMSNPSIGKQDHYVASIGGFHRYDFLEDGEVMVTRVDGNWGEFHSHMLLLYTGVTRKSDDLLKFQKDGFDAGKTIEIGKIMVHESERFYNQILNGKIGEAADTIHACWHLKRKLAQGISNEWIDKWYQDAMLNGAWGGKLCGAGGGGFLFFLAPPDAHDRIVQATGLQKVDFDIDREGSKIIYRS